MATWTAPHAPGQGLIQVPADFYLNLDHDSIGRFCAYWHQIQEIKKTGASRVLEIGVGNRFTGQYLTQRGIPVDTLDIDPELNPTFVGSVTQMPVKSEAYDCVACFEVLEHLPFELFPVALAEIRRVTRKWAILSLPDASRTYHIHARLPFGIKIKREFLPPNIPSRTLSPHSNHFWEIGVKGYPLKRIREVIRSCGFEIPDDYRVFEFHCNHVFVLRKADNGR